ncbi:MAG: hypothetical protein AB1744_13220, partial [Candidatus Zixiibacteriota bacterium]
ACQVRVNDVIHIKGGRSVTVEVLSLPTGSVPRADREKYVRVLSGNRRSGSESSPKAGTRNPTRQKNN